MFEEHYKYKKDDVKTNNIVKVSRNFETFIVKIKEKHSDFFIGEVKNILFNNEYKLYDHIIIEYKNIKKILLSNYLGIITQNNNYKIKYKDLIFIN